MMNFDDDFDGSDMDAGVDLTPIIDVLFLLLIFFIMTTTFAKPVVSVMLPEADSSAPATEPDQIQIIITDTARFFWNEEEVDMDALSSLFEAAPDVHINFTVDKAASFDIFMQVLDKARMSNRDDFSITTDHGA